MSKSILSCQQLKRTYFEGKNSLPVLQGIDLAIHEGETTAILGVSGSGKSTLLHLLGGLDRPSEGVVTWNDQNIAELNESTRCRLRNQHLGFVYQFHHLMPEFNALENVAMPLLIGDLDIADAKVRAMDAVEAVGLKARALHKIGELSGGERQRIAIARAIVMKPKCLIADEPTGNLDHKTANDILKLLLLLKETYKMSFIIATHDLTIANALDRIYHLDDGVLKRSDA